MTPSLAHHWSLLVLKGNSGDGGDDHDSDDHNVDACVDVDVALAAFIELVEGKTYRRLLFFMVGKKNKMQPTNPNAVT